MTNREFLITVVLVVVAVTGLLTAVVWLGSPPARFDAAHLIEVVLPLVPLAAAASLPLRRLRSRRPTSHG